VTGRITLIGMTLGLALVAGALGAAPVKKKAPAPAAEGRQLMQSCDAHKFETVVQDMVDGKPHQSKVKLCGKDGQTDAQWIDTLKDAVAKLGENKEMPATMREQIASALNAEIARLEIKGASTLTAPAGPATSSALEGVTPLPPLPQAKPPAAVALAPSPRAVPAAPMRDYAALPPLPTKPPAPVHVLPGGATSLAAMLPRPRMSFICYNPGEAEGPCTGFTRQTMLTVRAGEDLPADTSLRFVRDGDPQADVQLAQLKKGKSVRLTVPADVCRHVVGGKLELRIVRAGQEVGSDGPYNLNC